jgi:predicted transcriptional regulator
MRIKRINVNGEGLNRFFGPLEAKIMELLWSSGELSIREVQSVLNQETPISVNAVMTVMNRLREKGHLAKATGGIGRARGAKFKPVQTKEEFLAEQMRAESQGLIQEYGSLVVTHMIDVLDDADPEVIAKLEQKLNEMKQEKKP